MLQFCAQQLNEALIICDRLAKIYSIEDLGKLRHILGMEVAYDDSGRITLTQSEYIAEVANTFDMSTAKTKSTHLSPGSVLEPPPCDYKADQKFKTQYQSIIGCLLYIASSTRPDIAFAVSTLSRFNSNPSEIHFEAAKHVLRYLLGSPKMGISFHGNRATVVFEDSLMPATPLRLTAEVHPATCSSSRLALYLGDRLDNLLWLFRRVKPSMWLSVMLLLQSVCGCDLFLVLLASLSSRLLLFLKTTSRLSTWRLM